MRATSGGSWGPEGRLSERSGGAVVNGGDELTPSGGSVPVGLRTHKRKRAIGERRGGEGGGGKIGGEGWGRAPDQMGGGGLGRTPQFEKKWGDVGARPLAVQGGGGMGPLGKLGGVDWGGYFLMGERAMAACLLHCQVGCGREGSNQKGGDRGEVFCGKPPTEKAGMQFS